MLRVIDNENSFDVTDVPLEITVILPGECSSGIHYFDYFDPASSRGVSTGYSTMAFSVLPRVDIAYIESGSLAGRGLVQGGPNSLVSFDADVDSNDPIDDSVFSIATGGLGDTVQVTSLDAAPYPDRVATVTSDAPNVLRLIDPTIVAGNNTVFSVNFGDTAKVMAVDFEADGDIWAVVHRDYGYGIIHIYLWYAAYDGGIDYYPAWNAVSITADIGDETDVFDIAANWTNGYLYLFDAGSAGYGRITRYDVFDPVNPIASLAVDSLFDSLIDYQNDFDYGFAAFADIEIDHIGDNENCHILVYARNNGTFAELHKYDQNIDLVDVSYYEGPVSPSMTINPETEITDRDIMVPGQGTLGFLTAVDYL